jgi:hypothetical protein
MTSAIENNFNAIQKKTSHALVEQKVILSEQEMIDGFLDKLTETKKDHIKLIKEYRNLIDTTVDYLSESRNVNELISLSVAIESLIDITKRLINIFDDTRFNDFYLNEVKEYGMLMNDILEILVDVQGRVSNDKKLMDLLDSI